MTLLFEIKSFQTKILTQNEITMSNYISSQFDSRDVS